MTLISRIKSVEDVEIDEFLKVGDEYVEVSDVIQDPIFPDLVVLYIKVTLLYDVFTFVGKAHVPHKRGTKIQVWKEEL